LTYKFWYSTGYHLSRNLKATGCIQALKMALNSRIYPQRPLIHHSDRGIQYCCEAYVRMLESHKISISMTQSGSLYDNAIAERVNGILKSEVDFDGTFSRFNEVEQKVHDAINKYNWSGLTLVVTFKPHSTGDFIHIGFELEGKMTRTSAQNQAFSYIRKNAIIGAYPNVSIDYTKVLVTMGFIPLALDIEVSMDETGIVCTWRTELKVNGAHWADQVMIVAYCESLSKAVFLTAGARRYIGKEHMPIFNIPKGHDLEIYVSFISEDRKRIATSRYMGQLRW